MLSGHFRRSLNCKTALVSMGGFVRYMTLGDTLPKDFKPKTALLLTKLSRFEFEKLRYPELDDASLERTLKKRGSDYNTLLYHHYIHKGCEHRVQKCLTEFGVEIKVVNRFEYNEDNIEWADIIITTGGDGTYLMAANKIYNKDKPVVGFNTDPTRSEGYLCLPKKYSINIREAMKKLLEGKFRWSFRRRIRTHVIGDNFVPTPIELHDQQLQYPEYRFLDNPTEPGRNQPDDDPDERKRVTIPSLALNEVYLGECVSARVSYFEMSVNSSERIKTKNAGICICTGTGSTSWAYNITKITRQTVHDLFGIINAEGVESVNNTNSSLVDLVTNKFNEGLAFDPETEQMLYTIRDPISTYTLPYALEIPPRGFSKRIEVKSRCFDACMVIDGGLSFPFNDGTTAIFEMHDSDSLRTVDLLDE